MEIGLIYAILTAMSFGLGQTLTRRGVYYAGESFSGVLISAYMGIILFPILLVFTGEWSQIWLLSWDGLISPVLAGIVHFVLARLLMYKSIFLIGANRTNAITKTHILLTVILGIIILNEPLTTSVILGSLCIGIGAILAGMEKRITGMGKTSEISRIQVTGILSALGCGACWATSAVLIKPMFEVIDSPLLAAFISYLAATPILTCFLFRPVYRKQMTTLHFNSFFILVLAGLFLAIGQFFRYATIDYLPISIGQPITGTSILFLLLFSILFNRNIEIFTRKVVVGIVIAVVGVFIIY
ncbi:DMT family transporter [Chloroflexota bacterium]